MDTHGIEIIKFQEGGYKPLVDFESWRVAVLKYCDDVLLENIKTMQKHDQTDEVFVLFQGNCTLFIAGKGERPGMITAVPMEHHKVYNIKKGIWHNHILDKAGEVLIVENKNTTDANSPVCLLNKKQLLQLRNQ